MCVSGVHYLSKNIYKETQDKKADSRKELPKSVIFAGKIGQRTAKVMPCGPKRAESDSKIWMGIKLIAALTCQKIFGLNKRAMTFLVSGMFLTALKGTDSLNIKQKERIVRAFLNMFKFVEFSFYKEEFKKDISPELSKYSKSLTFPIPPKNYEDCISFLIGRARDVSFAGMKFLIE